MPHYWSALTRTKGNKLAYQVPYVKYYGCRYDRAMLINDLTYERWAKNMMARLSDFFICSFIKVMKWIYSFQSDFMSKCSSLPPNNVGETM